MLFKPPYTFLTTKPASRLLSRLHPEWLAILPIEDIANAAIYADVNYTDGTANFSEVLAIGDLLRAGEVQAVRIDFQTIDWDAIVPAKSIRYIELTIRSGGIALTNDDPLRYYPYTPDGDLELQRAIYYHNSYGGIDSLICLGDQQLSIETTGYTTARPLDLGYQLATAQYKYVDPYFTEVQQVITGKKPALELFALHDLFALKAAY